MKKLFTLLMASMFAIGAFAQAPEKMTYQAIVRNASGELVKSTSVGMRISILQNSESGTAVFVETRTTSTNGNGLVTIEIGNGTPVTGTFSAIDWSTGTYYIKSETDPTGGTNYTITGTSQILSVPYAIYAKTSKKANELEVKLLMLSNSMIAGGMAADIDGNSYNVVKVGTQVWMAENLKTTKYNDGSSIPNETVEATWTALTTGSYCDYNNDPANSTTYGRLYNWFAVNTGKLCPTGWHVPTNSEWKTLEMFLGMTQSEADATPPTGFRGTDQGTQLKSTIGWNSGGNGTNTVGFNGLPSGVRYWWGTFGSIGDGAYWWSSTVYSSNDSYRRILSFDKSTIYNYGNNKKDGSSVRCLKD